MFQSRMITYTTIAGISFFSCFTYLYCKAQPTPNNPVFFTKEAKQNRNGVRKDLWIAQTPTQRACSRIESEKSILIFRPKKHSMEIFEELSNIRCWIQEKNASNENQVYFILAKEGIYRYQGQHFEANNVFLSIHKIANAPFSFDLANHNPFLQGTAEKVVFSLNNGSQTFQASRFQASLGTPKQGKQTL